MGGGAHRLWLALISLFAFYNLGRRKLPCQDLLSTSHPSLHRSQVLPGSHAHQESQGARTCTQLTGVHGRVDQARPAGAGGRDGPRFKDRGGYKKASHNSARHANTFPQEAAAAQRKYAGVGRTLTNKSGT